MNAFNFRKRSSVVPASDPTVRVRGGQSLCQAALSAIAMQLTPEKKVFRPRILRFEHARGQLES